MSILTKPKILDMIRKKKIILDPLVLDNVGPASIDLTLDNKFRILTKGATINITSDLDHKGYSRLVKRQSLIMKPGDIVLGITKEKITLPDNVCGSLQGRSRFARLGLMIHVSSAFVQPGVSNKQVLEIVNLGKRPVKLNAGIRFCQIILQKTEGKSNYEGTYENQLNP